MAAWLPLAQLAFSMAHQAHEVDAIESYIKQLSQQFRQEEEENAGGGPSPEVQCPLCDGLFPMDDLALHSCSGNSRAQVSSDMIASESALLMTGFKGVVTSTSAALMKAQLPARKRRRLHKAQGLRGSEASDGSDDQERGAELSTATAQFSKTMYSNMEKLPSPTNMSAGSVRSTPSVSPVANSQAASISMIDRSTLQGDVASKASHIVDLTRNTDVALRPVAPTVVVEESLAEAMAREMEQKTRDGMPMRQPVPSVEPLPPVGIKKLHAAPLIVNRREKEAAEREAARKKLAAEREIARKLAGVALKKQTSLKKSRRVDAHLPSAGRDGRPKPMSKERKQFISDTLKNRATSKSPKRIPRAAATGSSESSNVESRRNSGLSVKPVLTDLDSRPRIRDSGASQVVQGDEGLSSSSDDDGSTSAEEVDTMYIVEKLVSAKVLRDSAGRNGVPEIKYLVRWKGFSSKDDTWEPYGHVNHLTDMLTDLYHRSGPIVREAMLEQKHVNIEKS